MNRLRMAILLMCLSGCCFIFAQGQSNTEQIVNNHVRSKASMLCEYISAIVKVSDLRPHPTNENMLIGTCCIDMGFEGYNGELLHYENVTKKIKFYVTKEEVDGTRDYLVFLGDVESLETRKRTY